ncbi:MAG: mechanosensitive ion channel [Xenococcaceae cyanobacterium MO_188.B29]|nr:mechanosensitive ion channel [Xenococcaceae cyanobacterium MO_188.B29]
MKLKKLLYLVKTAVVTCLLVVFLASSGVAQFSIDNTPLIFDNFLINPQRTTDTLKSPVVLDGRELFFVSESRDVSAKDRVNQIQSELQLAINSVQTPQVDIEQRNQLPVLYLNERYLHTVTNQDKLDAETLQERAERLKTILEQAITIGKRERDFRYLTQQSIIAIAILAIAIFGSRLLKQLEEHPLSEAIQKVVSFKFKAEDQAQTEEQQENSKFLTILFRLQLSIAQFILWGVVIFIISDLFPYSRQWRYYLINHFGNGFISIFTTKLFTLSGTSYSILDLLIILGLFLALLAIIRFLTNLLRTRVLQATGINRGSQEVILVITRYGLIFIGTIILLQASGLNLSSLTIIGSVLGVGIGFGLQDIAKNFASGLVLLFERSVQVGDFIQVGEHIGTVERVGARSIVLKTLDCVSIIVPNSRLLAEEVINWTHGNPSARLHIPVGVAYGSDVPKVKASLLQAAEEHPEVLRYPQTQVFFTGFGDNSLNFELLVWTSDPSRQAIITSDLYYCIEEILRKEEIQIPFPQRDLHLRMGNLSSLFSPELETNLSQWLKSLTAQQVNNKNNSYE